MPSASIHHRHRVRSDRSNTNANANCRFGAVSGDGEVVRPPPSLLCCCCDCADDCLSFIHQGLSMAEKIQLFLQVVCWRTRPSPKGAPPFRATFAARWPPAAHSLPFSSPLFSSTKRTLFFGGAAAAALPSFLPSGLLPLLWTSLLGPIL